MSHGSHQRDLANAKECGIGIRSALRLCQALAMAILCAACNDSASQATTAARTVELERVVAACTEAMVRSTCQVMNGPSTSSTVDVVFVAGIGRLDAKAYRQLRSSGEAMCSVVRDACAKDWNSAQCSTARGLWPAPGAGATTR